MGFTMLGKEFEFVSRIMCCHLILELTSKGAKTNAVFDFP